MKHSYWVVLALLATFSCRHEDFQIQIPESPKGIVSFGATAPEPESKVSTDGEHTIWVAGDKITLFYDGGSCTATAQSGGISTTFVTDDAIPTDKAVYCAVYPYTRRASFDGENVTVDFTQENEPGTFSYSAICTAKTTICGGALAFHNVGAMIKFTTSSNKIHEARFYGDNGNTYSLIGTNSDARIPYAAGTYYVPIPAGDSPTGFSLRVKNSDGEDYPAFYRGAGRSFESGHIYNVGNLESKVRADGTGGSGSFRLMSFNILRADQQGPSNNWAKRKEACLAMIEADKPDLLGLQECTSTQRNDILQAFPQYGAVGVSVTNLHISSYPKVSSNPILYNGNKFLLEAWGTFWLSETPDEQSNTWYYRKPRTATWARFKVKGQNRRFVYVCLHLQDNSSTGDGVTTIDYDGTAAQAGAACRALEMEVVTGKLSAINPDDLPVIISGDFNSDGTQTYYDTLRSIMGFSLARLEAGTGAGDRDTGNTFNGFAASTYVLDNIFYKDFTAFRFVVDRNSYAGRTYISDHYPVYSDFTFPASEGLLDGWNEEVF